MSVDHYENFPVASLLCPRHLRPAVVAIYRFARTADDIADEGGAPPQARLADLEAFGADLVAVASGTPPSARWPMVFWPLSTAIGAHALPVPLLAELLDAFEQDVRKHEYAERDELLDYCRRSANPVGRLLLHLYGIDDPQALQQSDAICTALQLVNFWQDLGVDVARGRLYVPLSECAQHGVDPAQLRDRQGSAQTRTLLASLVAWTRGMMLRGAPLVHRVQGSAGWELRLVVQGGLRILDRIEAGGFDTLRHRPRLHWHDAPALGWRALRMRDGASRTVSRAA